MVSNPTFDPNGLSNPTIAAEQSYDFSQLARGRRRFLTAFPHRHRAAFPSRLDVQGHHQHRRLQPQTKPHQLQLPPSRVDHLRGLQPGPQQRQRPALWRDDGHHAAAVVRTGLRHARRRDRGADPTHSAGLRVRHLWREASVVPNIDLPNVIPSTFSELDPNAQADLAYRPLVSTTTWPPRCKMPWWRRDRQPRGP